MAKYLTDHQIQRIEQEEFKFEALDASLTVHRASNWQVADPAGRPRQVALSSQTLEVHAEVGGVVIVSGRAVRHEQERM